MKYDKDVITSYDELPLVLNVEDISKILGISRATAYELVSREDFPKIKTGRLIKISKRAFFKWLEQN